MPHRLLRGTWMPFTTGLAAVLAVLAVLGSAPALAAGGPMTGDAARAQEWWLAGLQVTQAWKQSRGAGITVAVLGTGVDASHPDLAGVVTTGPDFSDSGRVPGSPYWGVEGTAVAAIIAGRGDDGNPAAGIVGVAPAAKILSLRVTLEFNDPLVSDPAISQRLPGAIADGIRYAVDHGARVIDLPLDPGTLGLTSSGDPAAAGGSAAERAAVDYALSRNVVLVAPAGDDGQGSQIVNYPAAYPGVIAVGAIGRSGQLAPFSSRLPYASLTAPGVQLATATPPDAYDQISSTGAAGGIVAGMAALILSRFPRLSVAQVTRALFESTTTVADRTGLPPLPARSDAGAGYGTVNAERAIQAAALISSAGQIRPSPAPARPRRPARRPAAAPRHQGASTLAGSVLRDAVAAVCALIVLLVIALVLVRSRRRGAAAASRTRIRGQHEHRRPDRVPAGPAGLPPGPAPASSRPRPTELAPPAAAGWPSPAGWQGGGIGQIGHSPSAPVRPVLAPAPKAAADQRAGRAAAAALDPAGPPWDPAPEPERRIGPLPLTSASSPPPERGPGIRVPRDMTAPAGTAAETAPAGADGLGPPAGFDLAAPPAGFDLATPAFGLTPPGLEFAAPPGPDLPTQHSLGFAAAPVTNGHEMMPVIQLTPQEGAGSAPPPDPGYIWDLAATDVFPAAAAPGAAPETAMAAGPGPQDQPSPDDASGAGPG